MPLDLPPDLTLAGLKSRMEKKLAKDDEVLGAYLEAAFDQAQAPWPDGCGRLLRPDPPIVNTGTEEAPVWADSGDPVVHTFKPGGRRRVMLPDARSLVEGAVLVDGTAVPAGSATTDGYELLMHKGVYVQLSVPTGTYGEVSVTGKFGFYPLPATLREAIYALANRYWLERAALQSDTVAVGEGAAPLTYLRQLPPRVRVAFSAYKKPLALGGAA